MIVGLGNPGPEYAGTRHNVGFAVLDSIAARDATPFHRKRTWQAEVAISKGVILCKPDSFMNSSGHPVAAVARFHQVIPEEIFVVLDDVALPIGKLRIRTNGSSGGHNGLQSVIGSLGTTVFPRLRIGIGPPPGPASLVGHVLGRFTPEESHALDESLARAVEAIDFAQANGTVEAMNKFN